MDTTQSPSALNSPPPPGFREVSTRECWELLRGGAVGRLAVISEGAPEIFPVNYVVDSGTLVIRTAGGTKHEAAHKRRIAFEVDGYDLTTSEAWSVVAKGRAVEVHDVDEVIEIMGLPLFPWAQGSKPHLLRLTPDVLTGRRFVVVGGAHEQ